ncbi:MAG: staygreen family protein [Paraclostridium sp.]
MSNLDSFKVNVNIVEPYTSTEPIRFRRYTVIHNEDSSVINVVISPYFEMLKFGTVSTDIIYGQWVWFTGDIYILNLFAFVGDYPYEIARLRYNQFSEKIPVSISAIVNGDKAFLENRPQLLKTPVFVRFISSYPKFNKLIPYNQIEDYLDDSIEVTTKPNA